MLKLISVAAERTAKILQGLWEEKDKPKFAREILIELGINKTFWILTFFSFHSLTN